MNSAHGTDAQERKKNIFLIIINDANGITKGSLYILGKKSFSLSLTPSNHSSFNWKSESSKRERENWSTQTKPTQFD